MDSTRTAQSGDAFVSAMGLMGDEMRFAEYGWANCEPSYEQVLAAVYLEAKGFTFGEHFDLKNVEECAENVYRAEMSMGEKN